MPARATLCSGGGSRGSRWLRVAGMPRCGTLARSPRTSSLIEAEIQHKIGIASATLFFRYGTTGAFTALPMTAGSGNSWSAPIPVVITPTTPYDYLQYYIEAVANDGKIQRRPMPAPQGYFETVLANAISLDQPKASFSAARDSCSQQHPHAHCAPAQRKLNASRSDTSSCSLSGCDPAVSLQT